MPGPLSHLTILDLSRVLAGPWCTQLLADLGATVIKIEKPGSGDDTRRGARRFSRTRRGATRRRPPTISRAIAASCRWRSTSRVPKASDLVRDLALQADVLVENFKMWRTRQIRPRLCERRGGQSASRLRVDHRLRPGRPYAERAGYDFIIQGMSGFMSVTGERDDLPGGGPQKAGVAITDLMTGMYAAVAILAALRARPHRATASGSTSRCSTRRSR